jgi:hypothetical protein
MNTAQALSYSEQKLLYMTMHSSILLMLCQFPNAGWELVGIGKSLGNQAGYSDQQLGQLHKKIMAQVTYRLQMQGRLSDIELRLYSHPSESYFENHLLRSTYIKIICLY